MRNNDPIFWPDSQYSHNLKSQMQKNYQDSIAILQTQWTQADLDERACLGDIDIYNTLFPQNLYSKRRAFNFNLINPVVQHITGAQRQNRKSTICTPIRNEFQKTADQFTKCLYYIHQGDGYQVLSDAFERGALVQGMGFVGIYLDYQDDIISPDIKLKYIDMKACLWDPFFRKPDMSDCRFFWTRQFFDREEAVAYYPQLKDRVYSLPSWGTYQDNKFYFMPEVYQLQSSDIMAFDEYYYLAQRPAQYLIDKETQECIEFPASKEDTAMILDQYGGRLKVTVKAKQTVRRAVLVNNEVLFDGPNPLGIDTYPVTPLLGYFCPETPIYSLKFRGVVRDMRDANYLFDRLKISDLDILEAQQQGLKVKEGALIKPEDGLNSGHGRMLVIKKSMQMSDVEPMPIVPPSPVMLQMEEMLKDVLYRIAGIDPNAMGLDVEDQSGIITMLREAASARNLQRLFDNLDFAQRLIGDKLVQVVQKKWTYGKVKQIIGEEPTAEFDNKAFYKYGCKVVQGALTETQQQLELKQLLYFREVTGIPIPSKRILEAANLQGKDKLIEEVLQQEQAQQQQAQKMEQLQLQQLQVDNETKLSYAESQQALGKERIAKIQLDRALNAERIQRAEEERTQSVLNLVKTIQEIENIDFQKVSNYLKLIGEIEESERMKAQENAPEVLTTVEV